MQTILICIFYKFSYYKNKVKIIKYNMIKELNNTNLRKKGYSKELLLSRILLIFEKIIGFLLMAYLANKLSYSDIGFWSQVIYFAGLYTSLAGLNISNGLISVVPRINKNKKKAELIFKSGLFLMFVALIIGLFLIAINNTISNLFFNEVLDFNIFIIILLIGFCEMMLEFVLYSFRSVENFYLSNYVLSLKLLPRIFVFIGVFKTNINLMLYIYSATFLLSCLLIFLKLYSNKKYNFFTVLKIKKNRKGISLLEPKPYLKSLFIISKKSIVATLTASLFFFISRSLILSNIGLRGVGQFSLAISAGATIMFLTNFVGFTFYPYISNLAINEKKVAYEKTKNLSFRLILFSILVAVIVVFIKIVFKTRVDFYPFTINSIDLILAFLGYGFLSAYQISQPFAFALTDNIKVIQIELISSLIAFGLFGSIFVGKGFSIEILLLTFCFYTLSNYLQAYSRNFKILNQMI